MTLFLFPLCRLPWPTSGPAQNALGCVETDTTLPRTRQARRPGVQARAGRAGRATCTHQTTAHTHPYRRQLPGDSCVVLSVCCAALCCDVAATRFCIAHLSTGPASLAADPVSHVTQRPFLLAFSLSLPGCQAAWLVSISHRSSGKVRASLLWPQMSSFNNGRLSEKRPANRAPQYPSCLPAAGRAGCDRNLDEPRDPSEEMGPSI